MQERLILTDLFRLDNNNHTQYAYANNYTSGNKRKDAQSTPQVFYLLLFLLKKKIFIPSFLSICIYRLKWYFAYYTIYFQYSHIYKYH